MSKPMLTISMPPHHRGEFTTRGIMLDVLLALAPALSAGFYFFGINVVLLTLTSVAACVVTEYVIQEHMLKQPITVGDLSAVVTGVLLAFNVPSSLPLWMMALGGVFAIGIAKMCFGGLGMNPFNPALIGRVFLVSSFPVAMTHWPKPSLPHIPVDAVTAATPLAIIKEGLSAGEPLATLMHRLPPYIDLFIGNRGGCIGEISVAALCLGFVYLLGRRVISWHIPTIIIVLVASLFGLHSLIFPGTVGPPLMHLFSGGLFLGAIFMATDYATSPMTEKGAIIYALGIGLLTYIIRVFGSYPEGISFAILIMNAFVPLIDRTFKPHRFGEGKS